jgi:guanosine-3',5'-bis(diphosphate) 3'-pyrophosphohydrolase
MSNHTLLVKATDFAARKHKKQKRKDKDATPYINHPIGVANNAIEVGGVDDVVVLQACLLHDTLEDTKTEYKELVKEFGEKVADVVQEVSDDKSLPKDERKRQQIEHAKTMSYQARIVKECDKLYNLRDLVSNPPPGYTLERIQGYCLWSRMVIDNMRGTNAALEKTLDDEIFNAAFVFEGSLYPCCPEGLSEEFIFPKV